MSKYNNLGPNDLIVIREMRIVVCDDADRFYAGEILASYGFQTIMLIDSGDLLGVLARSQETSGVLLRIDHSFPENMALLSELRIQQPKIPVITMGQIAHLSLLRKSIDLGATNYVVMPIDRELLKRKCLRAFHRPSSPALATAEYTTI